MARNVKIQVFVDIENAVKIQNYMREYNFKSESEAVYQIIRQHFINTDLQQVAVERLNKIIQGYDNKIKNLEYELRSKDSKEEKGFVIPKEENIKKKKEKEIQEPKKP